MAIAYKTWRFNSSAENWVATDGPDTISQWQPSGGSPNTGCLEARISGKNKTDVGNYWNISGTWETFFGISPGSTVTGLAPGTGSGVYVWRCSEYDTGGGDNSFQEFVLLDSTATITVLTISDPQVGVGSVTDWAVPTNRGKQSVPTLYRDSNTSLNLRLYNNLRTGNSASAAVTLRFDTVDLQIDYTIPTTAITGEYNIPVSWSSDVVAFSDNEKISVDWLQSLTNNKLEIIEWNTELNPQSRTINVDWLNSSVSVNRGVSADWLSEFILYSKIPVSWGLNLVNNYILPISWNSLVTLNRLIDVEWLNQVVSTTASDNSTVSIIPLSIIPSLEDGFATTAEECEYPELWNGLQALWVPNIGNQGDTLYDWSCYRNDGVLTNISSSTAWQYSSEPINGRVLGLDGINDRVSTNKSIINTSKFSLTAWIKPSRYGDINQGNGIFYQGTGASSLGTRFYIFTDAVDVQTIGGGVAGGSAVLCKAKQIVLNQWQHVAMIVNGDGTVDFYINGEFNTRASGAGTGVPSGDLSLGFWYNVADSARYFQGQLGPCSVYNRVLNASEIKLLYEQPLAQLQPQDVFYQIFNENISLSSPLVRSSNIDWFSEISNVRNIPLDWQSEAGASAFSSNKPLNIDWVQNIILNKEVQNEWINSLENNYNLNIEWLQKFTGNDIIPISFIGRISLVGLIPIDWQSPAGVSAFVGNKVLPVSWVANIGENRKIGVSYNSQSLIYSKIPVSWSQNLNLSINKIVPVDWLSAGNLQIFKSIGVDWLSLVDIYGKIPISWTSPTTAFSANKTIPIEWILANTSLELFKSVPIDWLEEGIPFDTWILGTRGRMWILPPDRNTIWVLPRRYIQ